MPPTEGERNDGGGGPQSSTRRGAHVSSPTPSSRAAQPEPSPSSSPQLLGKRSTRAVEKSGDDDEVNSYNKEKRTNVRSQEEETAAAGSSQENAAAGSASAAASQEEMVAPASHDGAASDVSSPIRIPDMVDEPWDDANIRAYNEESRKYQAKLDRQKELLTLGHHGPKTCLDEDELLPVRESVTQMVFKTAKAVLGLTSYIAGKLLKRCSGFLIKWDKDTKRGTVLTSANLLCTKTTVDDWSCPREYAPDAEVQIHLLDDTTQKGTLINYHKHYNIALFEVDMNMSTELPRPSTKQLVDYGQEVFLIGRDEDLNLNASYGRVQCIDRGYFCHYHYMYLECDFSEFGDGGPAIDTEGRLVGMTNPTAGAAFIPHLLTLKCLRMWKDFKCVPRLHLGLKVESVKFLESFRREKMSRKFNIDAGLIVLQVSEGSAAEKIAIRNGDVIESLNGKCIPTVVELEIMLLSTCEHCLDNGGDLGSNVDLMVGLFQTRKQKRCTKTLTLTVSDDMEVFVKGRYPVYAAQKNSVDVSSRQETRHGA